MEDSDQSKVFVGGISWETTEDVLREHFGNYGTVVGSVIAKDRNSGNPRGFAFVSFSDSSALDKVLLDTHTILGRMVEVKKAVPRSEQNQHQQEQNKGLNRSSRSNGTTSNNNLKTKKIFVGGLSANLTEEEFKVYFEKFGRITDVVVMHDNVTHRPRGFGFITFDSEDSVEEVMQKSFHELSGKLVEVKRAVPKEVCGSTGSNGCNNAQSRDSNFSGYQHGGYSPYSPRYEILPSYGPIPGYSGIGGYPFGGSIIGSSYPIAGYGGINYGMGPISPRVPWSGPPIVSIRGSPLQYGNPAAIYPAYLSGGHGLMGMVPNGYNGIVGAAPIGKSSQFSIGNEQARADAAPSGINRGNVDSNSLGSSFGETSKQDQSGIEGNMN